MMSAAPKCRQLIGANPTLSLEYALVSTNTHTHTHTHMHTHTKERCPIVSQHNVGDDAAQGFILYGPVGESVGPSVFALRDTAYVCAESRLGAPKTLGAGWANARMD